MVGSMASAVPRSPWGKPALAARHVAPLLMLLKTPEPYIPAYTVLGVPGSTASAPTYPPSGRPVLAALQVAPPLVVLNTPARRIPTYSVLGVPGAITRELVGVVGPSGA